jgi:hypothetical protein
MQTQTLPTPAPPAAAAPLAPGQRVVITNIPQSPTAVYQGYVAQRRELSDQLEALRDERRSISNQLHDESVRGADRAGLEQRVGTLDARITATDAQLAAAQAAVAKAAAVPGAVVPDPPRPIIQRSGPPEEAFVLGGIALIVIGLPLSIAYARRIWRRGAVAAAALPGELMDRLTRLDQAVDSIAVEVERIGEGQRFVTRVLAERGAPEALAAPQRPSAGALIEERRAR